jgi:hypothetical protein
LFTCGTHSPALGYNIIKDADSATVGFGFDIKTNSPVMARANMSYLTFYDLPIKPVEIESDMLTLGFCMDGNARRYACLGLVLDGVFFLEKYGDVFGGDVLWGLNLFDLLCLAPQCLGNFKIHLPIIKDGLHVYAGEATDYYIGYGKNSKLYTESKFGIKLFIEYLAVDCSINKPWLKGYLHNDCPYIGTHISFYVPRKKRSKFIITPKPNSRNDTTTINNEFVKHDTMTN